MKTAKEFLMSSYLNKFKWRLIGESCRIPTLFSELDLCKLWLFFFSYNCKFILVPFLSLYLGCEWNGFYARWQATALGKVPLIFFFPVIPFCTSCVRYSGLLTNHLYLSPLRQKQICVLAKHRAHSVRNFGLFKTPLKYIGTRQNSLSLGFWNRLEGWFLLSEYSSEAAKLVDNPQVTWKWDTEF